MPHVHCGIDLIEIIYKYVGFLELELELRFGRKKEKNLKEG